MAPLMRLGSGKVLNKVAIVLLINKIKEKVFDICMGKPEKSFQGTFCRAPSPTLKPAASQDTFLML